MCELCTGTHDKLFHVVKSCGFSLQVYPKSEGNLPKIAVRDLTMGIGYGECFGMLGPNGAGKTTTINMLGTCLL